MIRASGLTPTPGRGSAARRRVPLRSSPRAPGCVHRWDSGRVAAVERAPGAVTERDDEAGFDARPRLNGDRWRTRHAPAATHHRGRTASTGPARQCVCRVAAPRNRRCVGIDRSSAQPLTTLTAPRLDDRATGLGRHAMTEPVAAGSTSVVGLVRALHVAASLRRAGAGLAALPTVAGERTQRGVATPGAAPPIRFGRVLGREMWNSATANSRTPAFRLEVHHL